MGIYRAVDKGGAVYCVLAALTALLLTALLAQALPGWGAKAAYAADSTVEVPVGVTEVRVPVALPAADAVAGGELAFSSSAGLEFMRFERASGIINEVQATVGDITYIGFFAANNSFVPQGGSIAMGELVFSYTGDTSEQLLLKEMNLYTKNGQDVDVDRSYPNTLITVKRATVPGDGGDGGDGGDNGGDGGNNNGNNGENNNGGNNNNNSNNGNNNNNGNNGRNSSGGNNNGSGNGTGTSSGSGTGTGSGVGTGGGTGPGGTGSGSTGIGDVAAALGASTPGSSGGPPWASIWLALAAAAAVLALLLFLFIWRRRRRQEGPVGASGYGTTEVEPAVGDITASASGDMTSAGERKGV